MGILLGAPFLSLSLPFILDVDYRVCIIWIIHKQRCGFKVEEKLHLGVREQKLVYTVSSQMAVRLSALRVGRTLHPEKSSGTHLRWRLSRPQGLSAAERIGKLKNFNDLIGTQDGGWVDPRAGRIGKFKNFNDLIGTGTHYLPACSIVPQLTTLPQKNFSTFKAQQIKALPEHNPQ
jgi:hypothetical protein